MQGMAIQEATLWYDTHKDSYMKYCNDITHLIEQLIKTEGINYSSITGRVKEKESFIRKCRKDKYSEVNQITDIVGVRVVTYVQSDVARICSILENQFNVDVENSINKRIELKENEFGYLSIHYILSYNKVRKNLPENYIYKDMYFEIQIRTLLQHAWAEISHDNNYKFSGVLPKGINRKFYMIAGALELIDSQFQSIADELEAYIKDTEEQIKNTNGQADISIDSTSLYEYLDSKVENNLVKRTFNGRDEAIIDELEKFNINTIRELDNIIPKELGEKLKECKYHGNFLGLLRDIMIINDYDKYFAECWNGKWTGMDKVGADLYELYGIDIEEIEQYGIFIDEEVI